MFETGTCTDHKDYLNKLHTFISNNASIDRFVLDDELLFHIPSPSGVNSVFGGLKIEEDPLQDTYNLAVFGNIGYDAQASAYLQPGCYGFDNNNGVFLTLRNLSMEYWNFINGRRLISVIRNGTLWEVLHIGLLLPIMSPSQYSYPLLVSGSVSYKTHNFSNGDAWHSNLSSAVRTPVTTFDHRDSACRLRLSSGNWVGLDNVVGESDLRLFPNKNDINGTSNLIVRTIDDNYVVSKIMYYSDKPSGARSLWGWLDGAYSVTGFGLSSGDIIDVGGVNHLVVQNVFRTDDKDYICVRMD